MISQRETDSFYHIRKYRNHWKIDIADNSLVKTIKMPYEELQLMRRINLEWLQDNLGIEWLTHYKVTQFYSRNSYFVISFGKFGKNDFVYETQTRMYNNGPSVQQFYIEHEKNPQIVFSPNHRLQFMDVDKFNDPGWREYLLRELSKKGTLSSNIIKLLQVKLLATF